MDNDIFLIIGSILLIGVTLLFTAAWGNSLGMNPDIQAVDSTFCGNDYCKKLLEEYIKKSGK